MKRNKLFIRVPKDFQKLIDDLKENGYDSLHLPGGKSFDGKHSSFVVVWVSDFITKDVYLMTVPYRSSFHLEEKHKDSKKRETATETAKRELFEETGLVVESKDLFLFHEVQKFDNRRRSRRAFHFQYFFSLKKFMKVTDFKEEDFLIERSGETADPIFIPKKMVPKYLFYKHRIALGLK